MSNAKIFNQDVAFDFYTNEKYIDNLVYHTGYTLFYIYKDGHYEKLTPEQFRKIVIHHIREKFPRQNWTINSIKDIVSWVEHECIRQITEEHRHYIGFKDCVYNTRTFETEPHSIDKIVTYYLPYNFSETQDTPTPNFNRFIETSLVKPDGFTSDPKLQQVAQEAFGSVFIDNLKASKAFFLYGESGQNGKSTFTNLIRDVVGRDFCSALSLLDLSKQFGLSPLVGMKANVADELDDKFGSSKMFKQLVTGEPVSDRHIYGHTFTLYNRAKFFFSSNLIPTFDGLDGGLKRRVLILPFYREFKNGDVDKDFDLAEKLRVELPGIIGWAMEGAKRLVNNSYRFTESEATTHMMEEFEDEASSALRYFRDNCVVDKTFMSWIPMQKVYDDYVHWTISEGSKKPAGKKKFFKDIKTTWRAIDQKSMRYSDGQMFNGQVTTCINIIFKSDIITDEDEIKQLNM